MKLLESFTSYYEGFLDVVYPRNCTICQTALHKSEYQLCIKCQLLLPIINRKGPEINEFKSRFWGRVKVKQCYAYLRYDKSFSIKKILMEIKYKRNKELAEFFGKCMGECFLENYSVSFDSIIPVPLHPKKEKLRGFNQSEIIAKGFSESIGVNLDTQSVIRVKNTKTQTKMDRKERWENVKTIFSVVDQEQIKDKKIVLLDDVVTTGSTLESLSETVLMAGASEINFAVLAIAI
ncbi:ComF family protein [Hyphobacterium sp. CCMP332]|nr:ComF family protein [Hyphobacterium sp. CCMP332]